MALSYFDNNLDPYEISTVNPRLKALDWYAINSLYRQSFSLDTQATPSYKQVLVQQFSPKVINSSRNNWLINHTPIVRKYSYQATLTTNLPNG